MVKVAVMIVKRLAVVGCKNYYGVIRDIKLFKLVKELLNAGVHISDSAVILRADVFLIGAGRREPGIEIIAERLERIYRVKGMVIRSYSLPE